MKNCEFEKYFVDYVTGDLSENEKLEFHKHLNKCESCSNSLDEFYNFHQKIKNRNRPIPDSELVEKYHQELSDLFDDTSDKNSLLSKLSNFINSIIFPKSPKIRLAEVFVLIVSGIILGWFIFSPNSNQIVSKDNYTEYFSKPVNSEEIEYISYYFQAAELLLTELKNIDYTENNNSAEIEFNKSIAQKLLIKTFIVHEIALRQNDPQILRLLSKIEIFWHKIGIYLINSHLIVIFNQRRDFPLNINRESFLDKLNIFQKQIHNIVKIRKVK